MAESYLSVFTFEYYSKLLGTTEPTIRLLVSLFFGYPLALLHRRYLYGCKSDLQHIYFILCGLSIGYFNYGFDIIHAIIAIAYTYIITTVLNGSLLALQLSFIVNFLYLLIGYYLTSTDGYDIVWTMPHCVLVLRLIGYSFNVYDGRFRDEKLSNENRDVCIRDIPNFLEYFGYMCFPGSFLIGPQFPFKRYKNLVVGLYRDSNDKHSLPDCITPALKRLGLGLFYLLVFQIGSVFFTETYLLSERFGDLNYVLRLFYLAFWARMHLYKYISCWLITEGACIMFSVSHNGKDPITQRTNWNGCENVKLVLFETTTEFNHYIQSFNTNTNHWAAQYIYKRLKFLGNRYLSQLFTLLFLAVWHGFHSGYYVSFGMEFITIAFEKDFHSLLEKNPHVIRYFQQRAGMKLLLHIVLRLYTFVLMGWALAPFVLLKFARYWSVFVSVNYIGFIVFVPWFLVYKPLVTFLFRLFHVRNDD